MYIFFSEIHHSCGRLGGLPVGVEVKGEEGEGGRGRGWGDTLKVQSEEAAAGGGARGILAALDKKKKSGPGSPRPTARPPRLSHLASPPPSLSAPPPS